MPVGRAWGFRFVFALQMWTYHLALLPYFWKAADIFYTRDSLTAGLLAALRPKIRQKVFFEAHTFPASRLGIALQGWLARRIGGIVTINHLLAKRYKQFGCSPESISVIADAVEASSFALISRAAARQQLDIPTDRFIAMYVGQMYAWKGVDTLIAAAEHLSDEHCIWLVAAHLKSYHAFSARWLILMILWLLQPAISSIGKCLPIWQLQMCWCCPIRGTMRSRASIHPRSKCLNIWPRGARSLPPICLPFARSHRWRECAARSAG